MVVLALILWRAVSECSTRVSGFFPSVLTSSGSLARLDVGVLRTQGHAARSHRCCCFERLVFLSRLSREFCKLEAIIAIGQLGTWALVGDAMTAFRRSARVGRSFSLKALLPSVPAAPLAAVAAAAALGLRCSRAVGRWGA